jgi:YebC/PmpR family DNA-binding regulatory protein|tara:strand:- start:1461 stop:2177 length:717 start_codon:yes stop_codon:yes gene_type:complete
MGRAFEFRKARKMKRWSAMSKAFTRIGKEITLSAKEGGPSPDNNLRLRMAMQNAKAANMPKDNVERAIKKATDKDMVDFNEMVYEGYGAHGIAVLIETATDNTTRTVANVRSYFNKCNGSLGTSGSVEFMFEHKCFFKVNPEGLEIDELELELIDFGVDEIEGDDEDLMVMGNFAEFGNIQKGLDEKNIEIIESGTERIPTDTKTLTDEERKDVDKLLDKIEEDDDVINVYHTMSEEV